MVDAEDEDLAEDDGAPFSASDETSGASALGDLTRGSAAELPETPTVPGPNAG
jgi:hypothetical protein